MQSLLSVSIKHDVIILLSTALVVGTCATASAPVDEAAATAAGLVIILVISFWMA